MVRLPALALALAGACAYDASFGDCEIACTPSSGCPSGFACGAEGLCRPTALAGASCREDACDGEVVDVLANGGFDAADPPWRQDSVTWPSLLCGSPRIAPHGGALAACLGGGGDGAVDTLSRDLALPAGATSARLTGQLCIATAETEPGDRDALAFDLLDGAASIGALGRRTNLQGGAVCGFTSFTLDAPLAAAPARATFRIRSTLDAGEPTSFFVDSLVLTVCR